MHDEMAVGCNGDVPQKSTCAAHEWTRAALYCKTCEVLICTKCISHGPSGTAQHKEHVYLDLNDAYQILKEEFEKVVLGFREDLQTKKNERHELQTTIQKLKLELLRKKTQAEGRTRSLKDTIKTREQEYRKDLERVVHPAIHRSENQYKDVEYDVVCREGLLGTAESILAVPPDKCIAFLQNVSRVKRDMQDVLAQTQPFAMGDLSELRLLRDTSLVLQAQKRIVGHAFDFPKTVPSTPAILTQWCTVGRDSAAITWKFSKAEKIDQFRLYYRPVTRHDRRHHRQQPRSKDASQRKNQNLTKESEDIPETCVAATEETVEKITGQIFLNDSCSPQENKMRSLQCKKTQSTKDSIINPDLSGFLCVKIRKFTPGRTMAVLRHLKPETDYVLRICAENSVGHSQHDVVYFSTIEGASTEKKSRAGKVVRDHPRRNCCLKLLRAMFRGVFYILIMAYVVLSVCVLWRFRRMLWSDGCSYMADILESRGIYESLCPAGIQADSVDGCYRETWADFPTSALNLRRRFFGFAAHEDEYHEELAQTTDDNPWFSLDWLTGWWLRGVSMATDREE